MRRTERVLTRWRRFGAVVAVFGLTSLGAIWLAHKQAMRAEVRAAQEAALRQRIQAQELMTRQTLYAADMNLVQQAIVAGNFGRAEELLAAYWPTDGQSDLRGFGRYHYWERVRGDTLGVLRGHEQLVTALALSRDGRRLYSASFDCTLREWSLDTLREQHQWSWPGSLLLGLAPDPTGRSLVVAMNNPPRWAQLDVATATWREFASSGAPSSGLGPEGDRLLRGNRIVLFETDAVTEIVPVERGELERVLDGSGGRAWFVPGGNATAARLRPANDTDTPLPGVLTLDRDLMLGPTGVIAVVISGAEAGNQTRVEVLGTAALSGRLEGTSETAMRRGRR